MSENIKLSKKRAIAFATWISVNNYNPDWNGTWFVFENDVRKDYTSRQLYNKFDKENPIKSRKSKATVIKIEKPF